ncbi:MAG: hypothetical protein J5785_06895 [Spirochaetales bacterium]|nr:hypothetical protein [Spirochaetales bacterium]
MIERIIKEIDSHLRECETLRMNGTEAVKGELMFVLERGKIRYYRWLRESGIKEYLGRGREEEIRQLAQKAYEQGYMALISRQVSLLERFREDLLKLGSEAGVFNVLPKHIKRFVVPLGMDARKWKASKRPANRFGAGDGLKTAGGEYVISKSEVIIADRLAAAGVPYLYEVPVYLEERVYYPDFLLLNRRTGKEFRWEHFGKMDDPEYSHKTLSKLSVFSRNGIILWDNLLVTWEAGNWPLDPARVDYLIESYLL